MIFLGSRLKKAILALGLVCVLSGCNTVEAPIAREEIEEMGVRAEAAEDGIRLSFSNIPPDSSRIFIHVSDWGGKEEIEGSHEIVSRFVDIRGSALEKLKASGRITCPFVKGGLNYEIAVHWGNNDEPEAEKWLFTECIAESGIYFADGLRLTLNENQTAVSLSAEPVFSQEVEFAPIKYQYGVTIKKGEYWSIGVNNYSAAGNPQALTWQFQPFLRDDINAGGHLESGDYPAYAIVYCNALYDGFAWSLELAKSRIFTVRF